MNKFRGVPKRLSEKQYVLDRNALKTTLLYIIVSRKAISFEKQKKSAPPLQRCAPQNYGNFNEIL